MTIINGTIHPVLLKVIVVEPVSAVDPVTRVANADSPAVPGVETVTGDAQQGLQSEACDMAHSFWPICNAI